MLVGYSWCCSQPALPFDQRPERKDAPVAGLGVGAGTAAATGAGAPAAAAVVVAAAAGVAAVAAAAAASAAATAAAAGRGSVGLAFQGKSWAAAEKCLSWGPACFSFSTMTFRKVFLGA